MSTHSRLDTDIVVVGAGPAGLTVALQSTLLGARVRIVERRSEPREWAPALAVQPRTMEVLRGLGVADDLLARGVSEVGLQVHIGRHIVEGRLHDLRLPETEYPFIFFVPQPEVEAVLRERLAGLGVKVEWDTEFTGLEEKGDEVHCQVRTVEGKRKLIASRYLAGCDGRESTVRLRLGIPFPGRRYPQTIVVGDAEPTRDLSTGTAHVFITGRGIVFFFPLPSGRWRVIGPHRGGTEQPDLRTLVEEHTGGTVKVGEVDWVKAITPHHRLAGRFRMGRVFLAGDAAHTHSPAGAQGMNTGIQDAVNLGWKLALATSGAPEDLLDTYESERRPVARHVVRLTGLAYALEVSDPPWLRLGRRIVAEPVARMFLSRPGILSMVARLVVGLDMGYQRGAMRHKGPGSRARPGARLLDARLIGGPPDRVHDLIDGTAFHLLAFEDGVLEVIGGTIGGLSTILRTHRVRGFLLSSRRRRYPAFVLVRPDGHVAISGDKADVGLVTQYFDRWLGAGDPIAAIAR